MKIRVEITEDELKAMVVQKLQYVLGDEFRGDVSAVKIEVKSKQNYKSEWEPAAFRAVFET